MSTMVNISSEKRQSAYYTLSKFIGNKVLVIAPHPDDETFGCGGSMCLHRDNGDSVKVVVVTDGSKGDYLKQYPDTNTYVAIRQEETRRALKILGVEDIEFWGFKDQEVSGSFDFYEKLLHLLELYEPTLVYAPASTEHHSDHRATNNIVWRAVRHSTSIKHLLFYEVYPPTTPNCYVDISDVAYLKLKASKEFKSQNEVFAYATAIEGLNAFRAMKLPKDVTSAEAFIEYSIT